MKSWSVYLLVWIGLGLVLQDFCHQKTKGFRLQKIAQDLPYDARWEFPSPQQDIFLEEEKPLDQPFYYLKKGKSSYVFVSKDGQYVLKFLQAHRITPPFWVNWTFIQTLFPSYCQRQIAQKRRQKEAQFSSYKIAFEELQDQTKVLYCHLNVTTATKPLQKPLILYDNIGIEHTLSADKASFILQKKAFPFCPYFRALIRDQNEEETKKLLLEFASFLEKRASKGICDHDLSPQYNLGIIGGSLVTFDLDSLRRASQDLPLHAHKMQDARKMLRWLKKLSPELSAFLRDTLIRSDCQPGLERGSPSLWPTHSLQ